MKVLVARIPTEGSRLTGTQSRDILQLEEHRFIERGEDIHYDFFVQRVSNELIVRGEFNVTLSIQCSRCAEFFSTSLRVSDFLRAYSAPDGTDEVVIDEDLREEFVLQLPSFPLCEQSCAGKCVRCGVNLNEASCRCKQEEGPNPWSALDALDI